MRYRQAASAGISAMGFGERFVVRVSWNSGSVLVGPCGDHEYRAAHGQPSRCRARMCGNHSRLLLLF